jgi:hypothetical protein
MCKGTRTSEVGEVLSCAHRAGIWSLVFVLFGFPTETAEEWDETVRFLDLHREGIDALSRSRFVLARGSKIFLDPERYGISRILDRPDRDPVSIAYDFEVASGLTREEAGERFGKTAALLSRIGRSPHFARYRDHMLIHAAGAAPA